MSKKVISILLSAAMLVAIFCVGFGALSASADDNVTYYFLAPDNYFKTEAGASNTNVGYYFWEAGGNGAWPGQAATPAPEVHPNAFKISVPNNDNVATIIFNAFVDAGSPADPDLEKVAHQTANINVEAEDYDGYIYVLAQDAAHTSTNDLSGAVTSSGNWFKLDEFKTSYNYGTYGFADSSTATQDTPAQGGTTSTPASNKTWKAGATVTVTYEIGNIPHAGSFNDVISYNTEYLKYESKEKLKVDDSKLEFNTEDGKLLLGGLFAQPTDPDDSYTDVFAGSTKTTLWTFTFTALKDFNEEDLDLSSYTEKWVETIDGGIQDGKRVSTTHNIINENKVADDVLAANPNAQKSDYVELNYSIAGEKNDNGSTSSTASTASTSSTVTSSTATSSTAASSTTSSDPKGTNDKASSTTSGGKSTTSTSTTAASSTTPTVQTAGTFAVISLVVILMAAAGVVIYTRKKTEE